MGTTRENNYREHEYTEGKYLICQMENGVWEVFEMAEFNEPPLEYDPSCLSDTGQHFSTLREARAWCKSQKGE